MKGQSVHFEVLPYQPDSCLWFERIRDLPAPLFLDSCFPHAGTGRYDILTADPIRAHIYCAEETTGYVDVLEYFESLAESHRAVCDGLQQIPHALPFCGGLAGCLDYGLGKPLQHLPPEAGTRARVYLYGWALVQDHRQQRCTLITLPALPSARRRDILARLKHSPQGTEAGEAFEVLTPFSPDLDLHRYRQAFERIQHYIHAGDCYQVNLARRFSAPFRGDPWQAYRDLRPLAAATFSAYMDTGDRQLLCLSPERFLKVSGQRVETSPIKGTRPRLRDSRTDAAAADALRRSPKDRAENLMIVDLLRNDIGRNCVPGSVAVDRLFELQSYPTVHHLVSTISGRALPDASALDFLRDCFPGGSITGAPKRRAMQVIDELESGYRHAYCGSLFYFSADGRLDSNIAIRSLLCERGTVNCWGGGGIVADSDCEGEYRETWDKVGRFIRTLEQTVPR